MKVVRQISGYKTSRSYDTLWDLAKNQSIVCICKYKSGSRDVAHTIWTDTLVEISARGICYVSADSLESFIEECKLADVEWILPETQYIVPQKTT